MSAWQPNNWSMENFDMEIFQPRVPWHCKVAVAIRKKWVNFLGVIPLPPWPQHQLWAFLSNPSAGYAWTYHWANHVMITWWNCTKIWHKSPVLSTNVIVAACLSLLSARDTNCRMRMRIRILTTLMIITNCYSYDDDRWWHFATPIAKGGPKTWRKVS